MGITRSYQLTLTDETRTARAIWKTIDESRPGVTNFQGGGFVVDFSDSWKHEVASYELDKLLGTGLVPPTVERTLDRVPGSLQMWVEKAMTEADRKERRITPPDTESWNRQMWGVRLLHQLTFNTDAKNIRNVLCDPTFRIYAVDFSRAFAIYDDLRAPNELERFSRDSLEKLRALDPPHARRPARPLAERPPDRDAPQAPRQDRRAGRAPGGREGQSASVLFQ